jgi:hypothetical protein
MLDAVYSHISDHVAAAGNNVVLSAGPAGKQASRQSKQKIVETYNNKRSTAGTAQPSSADLVINNIPPCRCCTHMDQAK